MARSIGEIDTLWKESVVREEALRKEYLRTHDIPSRGIIVTPAIQAEKDLRKQLYLESLKLEENKD